ncbi:MAG: TIGR01212 family radical SAM protein [Bacteroidales bacterium]
MEESRVSIDAGFTCPNRDGSKATGGCTYCNNDAFNPSYCLPETGVSAQIQKGIQFHRKRYRRAVGYLAYFQAYSNTYSSLDHLKEIYEEALSYPEIKGLVIGTRPDCIDEAKLEYFSSLAARTYLSIEYGVESCYDATLDRINRGHDFKTSADAIKATALRGINSGAHLIFGLPGESREDMLNEAGIISGLPLTSIKFHQLQVVKGTAMEREYEKDPGSFNLFTWNGYRDFLVEFIERLNPAIQIDRLTGEAPPGMIVAPVWGLGKSDNLAGQIEARLEELDTWQGKRCGVRE